MAAHPLFSIITPSFGKRPTALGLALDSVQCAMEHAGLGLEDVEILVGYDGVTGEKVRAYPFVRYFNLPHQGNFGNANRNILLNVSKGKRILFLDDDNSLTPEALEIYSRFPDIEMIIARIDVSKAFSGRFLPEKVEGRELIRPTNVDPLCLCLSRDLVVLRCGGWRNYEGYESDYHNIARYHRRARSITTCDETVGIYDSGRGLDPEGLNHRQQQLELNRRTSS